jgi:hypothetical protein
MLNSSESKSTPIFIPINLEAFKDGLRNLMMNRASQDEIVRLIVEFDHLCQDWGVTEKLIAHFKALEIEMMAEENCGPTEPQKIDI